MTNKYLFEHLAGRSLRTLASETGKFEPEKYKIQKGFGLVVVNEKFHNSRYDRKGADVDKKNIEEFYKSANITVNDTNLSTHDLTGSDMKKLFKDISRRDFSPYDAFICFISSRGSSEKIWGVDEENICEDEILKSLKDCHTLVGKPKLFFIHRCGGEKRDPGVPQVVADHASDVILPFESDVLIASSSVDGYESYRSPEQGSWFITLLTEVLNKHAHNMNLTDILTIVNNEISKEEHKDGSKQMPRFTSTLRKAVHFDVPKSNESPLSSQKASPIKPVSSTISIISKFNNFNN